MLGLAVGGGIASCGCDGSPVPALASATATRVEAIRPAGGVLSFPVVGGYGGTFVYSANDASGTATATVTTSTEPVAALPFPAPSGTILAAYTLTLDRTVTFTAWHNLLSTITAPATVLATGRTFSEFGYDVTATGVLAMGSNPGTVSGQSIWFGDGLGNVALAGNHTYLILLVMR